MLKFCVVCGGGKKFKNVAPHTNWQLTPKKREKKKQVLLALLCHVDHGGFELRSQWVIIFAHSVNVRLVKGSNALSTNRGLFFIAMLAGYDHVIWASDMQSRPSDKLECGLVNTCHRTGQDVLRCQQYSTLCWKRNDPVRTKRHCWIDLSHNRTIVRQQCGNDCCVCIRCQGE